MMLTDGGVMQLEMWRNRLALCVASIVHGRPPADSAPSEAWPAADRHLPDSLPSDPSARPEAGLLRFRSRISQPAACTDLSDNEQRARILALRGLSQARDGEYDQARTLFESAARLDPGLDLAMLPSFWRLPRRVHEAAIAALYDANRRRDAAALRATMNMRFRPRALRAINPARVGANEPER